MVDIDKFNNIYEQYLNDIKNIFSFSKNVIDEYETDNYIKMFMNNSILLLEYISLGNSEELIENNYFITDGIKFKEIWEDSKCSKDTKEKLWDYLHSMLYLICNDELENYINQNFKEHKKYDIMIEKAKLYEEYLKNIKDFKSNESDNNVNLENSTIGNLAKEIMDEMGLDENSNKEPSMADLGKMMTTTFNTINNKMQSGEFDQTKMMEEAQKMMGGMNLFGNDTPQMPKGFQGMPKNMNVNKRKVTRKKNKLDNKNVKKTDS